MSVLLAAAARSIADADTDAIVLTTLDDTILPHQPCWAGGLLCSAAAGPSAIAIAVFDGLELAVSTRTGRTLEYNGLTKGSSRYA